MPRINLDVTIEQHRQLKTLASYTGISMREFILSRVFTESAENVFQLRKNPNQLKSTDEIEKIEAVFFDKKKALILSEQKWEKAQAKK